MAHYNSNFKKKKKKKKTFKLKLKLKTVSSQLLYIHKMAAMVALRLFSQ